MKRRFGLSILALLAFFPAMDAHSQSSKSYSYDELGRLVTVTPSSGSPTTYGYDHADNRTSVSPSAPPPSPPVCSADTINISGVPTTASANVTVTSAMILGQCTDANGYTLSVTSPTNLPETLTLRGGSNATVSYTVSDGHGNTASNSIQINVQ